MKFRVLPTDVFLADVVAIHEWIVTQGSPRTADRWVDGLMHALRGLTTFPHRFPVARESAEFSDVVVRQLVFGRVRVLYAVFGADVVVFHARHGNRLDATSEDLGEWPGAVQDGPSCGRVRNEMACAVTCSP